MLTLLLLFFFSPFSYNVLLVPSLVQYFPHLLHSRPPFLIPFLSFLFFLFLDAQTRQASTTTALRVKKVQKKKREEADKMRGETGGGGLLFLFLLRLLLQQRRRRRGRLLLFFLYSLSPTPAVPLPPPLSTLYV